MNNIEFKSDNLNLAGHLHLPEGFSPKKQYAAVVVAGSLTSVKEQMSDTYAAKLAQQGFVALSFDFRNYGESEGEIRQYEDPELKLKDLEAAVSYLLGQEFVKSVGGLGICTAGGNMAYLAHQDDRLEAFVTIAAWLPNDETLPLLYGGKEALETLRLKGEAAKEVYNSKGVNEIIPAYSDQDETASHVGPMEYYMDKNRGGGVPEWKNEFSVMSWNTWLDFDPISRAKEINVPAMIIHSDGSALPNNAKLFYEQLSGKKELIWLEVNHFDFYDQEEQVNRSSNHASEFFHKTLNQ
ncbi:hypothetical protein BFP71_04980 [Roseivirga misakiensis]|uniref:Dienelactone hydrolase domain-containing protein n=2 Tax=Roseivirga misakiensis TaxID=1563681 RepID=A0A1E5T7A5_9BACT|nr:hypothetical protein BFP71_04980 [Roseivirga misakiensis]